MGRAGRQAEGGGGNVWCGPSSFNVRMGAADLVETRKEMRGSACDQCLGLGRGGWKRLAGKAWHGQDDRAGVWPGLVAK